MMSKVNNANIEDFVQYSEESPSGLVWKVSRGRVKAGSVVGNIKSNGYYQFMLFGENYSNHVPIWKLHNGLIPDGMVIDHINNDPLCNLIHNLRLCTQADNCRNRVQREGMTSRYKGVHWNKAANKWKAKIVVNYKNIHLGYFDSEDLAAQTHKAAAKKFYGEFAYHDEKKEIFP